MKCYLRPNIDFVEALIFIEMYVYKTTNLSNNLIYIGISRKESEKSKNYLGSGKLLKKAIKEFGKSSFVKTIIVEDSEFMYQDLQRLEIFIIDLFDARNPKIGYNISEGGDGNVGENNGMYNKKHSDETKDKISKTRLKKIKADPSFGKREEESSLKFSAFIAERNMVSPTLPNGHSEESKLKISETLKEKASLGLLHNNHAKFTDERKQEYSEKFSGELNPFYGKSHSEESKNKIKQSIRNRFPSVLRLDLEDNLICEYESIVDVYKDGFRPDLVKKVLKGENKTHGGYFWKLTSNSD